MKNFTRTFSKAPATQRKTTSFEDRPYPDKSLLPHISTLISLVRGKKSAQSKENLSPAEIDSFSKALLLLQRGLTGERNLAGAGYMDKKNFLGAYLLYYWPVSYIQVGNALLSADSELQDILNDASKQNRPIRILDLGSGPGPASAAIYDFCIAFCRKNNVQLSFEFTLTDSSSEALECAKNILLDAAHKNHLADESSPKITLLAADFENDFPNVQNSFDVVIASHSLNELWSDADSPVKERLSFVEKIAKNLSDTGLLFLIEPALLSTSRNLMLLRDGLSKSGYSVVSPCPPSLECPALKAGGQHTCHAEIRWNVCEPVASLAKTAGLDRDSVKMTFFVFSPSSSGKEQNDDMLTVVSDGMLNKSGRVRYLLCNGNERIAFSAKKDDATATKQGFFSLRRYDKVRIENPEIRGVEGALGVAQNTIISKSAGFEKQSHKRLFEVIL